MVLPIFTQGGETMNIVFYGLSKKKNSTLQPAAGASSWSYTGTLKEPSSVLHPVIKIKRPSEDFVPVYTYAYISKFGRYYFVDDVRWVEPFWEISMSVDVLASFKTLIGLSSHYILRTDNNTTGYNGAITDTMYPATNDFTLAQYSSPNVFASYLADGCYIVGIISNASTNAVGAISYYAMTAAQFGALKNLLLSDSNLVAMGILDPTDPTQVLVTDMSAEVLKAMYNPFQYIASCMWFPFSASAITSKTAVTTIDIGWWSYSLSGYSISVQNIEFAESPLSIHAHPQAATRGSYLNYAPYTRCTIYGRFGSIPLDLSFFGEDSDNLVVSYLVDIITGQCRTTIETFKAGASPTYHKVAQTYFELGVPIQLAQIVSDYLGAAVTAVSAAADTASKALSLNVAGAVSSAANGIYNTLNAAMPQLATSGANGSLIVAGTLTTLVFQHFTIVDEDIAHKGRPLCEIKQINTLSGYILCADGEFDISCFDEERTMIQDYLTSGFFWE